MTRLLVLALALFCVTPAKCAQSPQNSGPPPVPPRDIIEEIWDMGVSGELLTAEGWRRASGYYIEPGPAPEDKSFDVFSNFYGLFAESIKGDHAEVAMEFINAGRIDATLRYTPAPPSHFYKTARVFDLTLTPTYILMFGPDGKTLIEKKPTKSSAWEIEGPVGRPWTTVNTAIRYLLETRNKATNPVLKKNADETIAKLLKLH